MKYIATLLIGCTALAGCMSNHGIERFGPECPSKKPKTIDDIYQSWACGAVKDAMIAAREGAAHGDSEMARVYLQILASKNKSHLGLALAVKFSEQGDIATTMWAIRIVEKEKLNSIKPAIYETLMRNTQKSNGLDYLYLTEVRDFSMNSSDSKEVDNFCTLLSLSKTKLDERQYIEMHKKASCP